MKFIRVLVVCVASCTSLALFAGDDWAQFNRYERANKELLADSNFVTPKIVFIGNSITEGWVKEHPDFFSENNYVGRGISGQTSYQTLVRFREDVINLKPQIVVINAGTNDVAENNHVFNEARTLGNIMSMAELAQGNGIQVVLTSVLPTNSFYWNENIKDVSNKIKSLNNSIKTYAENSGLVFLNFYDVMANENGDMISDYTEDGVHPNSKGYDVMEQVVSEASL